MGMEFAPTWLRQVSPLFHKTTLTTANDPSDKWTVPLTSVLPALSYLDEKVVVALYHNAICTSKNFGRTSTLVIPPLRILRGNVSPSRLSTPCQNRPKSSKTTDVNLRKRLRTRSRQNLTMISILAGINLKHCPVYIHHLSIHSTHNAVHCWK